jgi:Methyltransferase FkbM domain
MNQASILNLVRQAQPLRATASPKVRIGSHGDGGYVVNHVFDGLGTVLSLGVGDNATFDLFFHSQGIPVVQVDGTIDKPPFETAAFIRKNIAKESATTTISLADVHEVAAGLPGLSGKDMILKFDIEGSEWDMFLNSSSFLLKRFRIITGEFHGLTRLLDGNFFLRARMVLDKLCQYHQVTHIHANNIGKVGMLEGILIPDLLEVSFLRRDFGPFEASDEPIPGPLDYPNQPDKPDIVLKPF